MDPRVHDVLEKVSEFYEASHGLPFPDHARAAKDIKALLKTKEPGQVIEAYRRYLLDREKFHADHAWGKFRNWWAGKAAPKHSSVGASSPCSPQPSQPRPEVSRPSKEAVEAYLAIMREAKRRVEKHVFETWLEALQPVTLSDGCLTLRAPNPLVSEWIEKNLGPVVREVSESAGVRLAIVHAGQEAA